MIIRDGRLADAAPVFPAAVSFGAFSTFGCDQGRPFLWSDHIERLETTLCVLAPDLPIMLPDENQVVRLLSELKLEGLGRGRMVGFLADDSRWQIELSATAIEGSGLNMKPQRLLTTKWADSPPLAGFKTLARLPWDLARRQAEAAGWDDALLIGRGSKILETSVANVFLRFGREITTPIAPEDCLPGIMRGWLKKNINRLGMAVRECNVSLRDLKQADEVWTSNAVIGIRRVAAVDDVSWTEWPIYQQLRQLGVPAPGWY